MENLHIEPKKNVFYIPEIKLNAETGECSIKGDSYLEDTVKFYGPVLDWLYEYTATVSGLITFNFSLNYYDTRSSKSFIDILLILKDYIKRGGRVNINWFVEDDDDDLMEEVEDYSKKVEIDIKIIPVS